MRGLIAAVSPEWVIGLDGGIPWRHPGDVRRFKRVTLCTTVIMGRATWESMPSKLPGRRNVVVTSQPLQRPDPDVDTFRTIEAALATQRTEDLWFVGGTGIYRAGMSYCDILDITYVPDRIEDPRAVRFPPIDATMFAPGPRIPHEDEPGLERQIWTRIVR